MSAIEPAVPYAAIPLLLSAAAGLHVCCLQLVYRSIIDRCGCQLECGGPPVSQPVASRRTLAGHRLTDWAKQKLALAPDILRPQQPLIRPCSKHDTAPYTWTNKVVRRMSTVQPCVTVSQLQSDIFISVRQWHVTASHSSEHCRTESFVNQCWTGCRCYNIGYWPPYKSCKSVSTGCACAREFSV